MTNTALLDLIMQSGQEFAHLEDFKAHLEHQLAAGSDLSPHEVISLRDSITNTERLMEVHTAEYETKFAAIEAATAHQPLPIRILST
jgi:hypothetical protein